MKLILKVCGVLLILMGAVWILQGINVLPGSVMTGQLKWAMYGLIAFVLGCGVLCLAWRQHEHR